MTDVDYPIYDFVTASKVERPLAIALKVWLDKFAKMFVERWKEFAPTEIQVRPLAIDSTSFESLQAKWKQPAVGAPIIVNHGAVNGMIVAERVELLVLLMEVLCESLQEKPTDRELTSVETSLCQLLFEQSVATFGEAWPDKDILPTELEPMDWHPNRCRLFPPQHEVLVTGFEIKTSSAAETGPARLQWVFAKDEMKKLLGIESTVDSTATSGQKISAENISNIMVEVSAALGSTELDMNELIQLDAGDIVKLDQRIEVPLILFVNDQPVFEAWPGRNGDKQCFQVESIIS
jgi:flagellar motor switch protein FliM